MEWERALSRAPARLSCRAKIHKSRRKAFTHLRITSDDDETGAIDLTIVIRIIIMLSILETSLARSLEQGASEPHGSYYDSQTVRMYSG